MNCTCFLVKPGHNDGWLIEGGRRDMGPYHSRDLALQVAVSECLAMRRARRPARGPGHDRRWEANGKRCQCASFGR